MENTTILTIIISVILSINGITLGIFVSNVRELKKVIQELAISIKGSQKDIEFLNKTVEIHEKALEKHDQEIDKLKLNNPSRN
jgi:DNA-binding NtrC family response regulator